MEPSKCCKLILLLVIPLTFASGSFDDIEDLQRLELMKVSSKNSQQNENLNVRSAKTYEHKLEIPNRSFTNQENRVLPANDGELFSSDSTDLLDNVARKTRNTN